MEFPSLDIKKAFEKAKEALNNTYSPYSHFKVAACLKVKEKDIFIKGVNVENSSFGATICAERSAIVSLISQYGPKEKIEFLLLCTEPSTVPCAICRQVLVEFASPDLPIYITSLKKGLEKTLTLGEILPYSFNKEEFERVSQDEIN